MAAGDAGCLGGRIAVTKATWSGCCRGWRNCFAQIEPHGAELLASLGRSLAVVDDALEGFFHPAADRTFYWDLRARIGAAHLELLSEPRVRWWRLPGACVAVDFGGLRQSIIYNDANDYNVLASPMARASLRCWIWAIWCTRPRYAISPSRWPT